MSLWRPSDCVRCWRRFPSNVAPSAVESALMLLDERHLAFYRERARGLVDAGFVEPWVDAEGRVHEAQSAA